MSMPIITILALVALLGHAFLFSGDLAYFVKSKHTLNAWRGQGTQHASTLLLLCDTVLLLALFYPHATLDLWPVCFSILYLMVLLVRFSTLLYKTNALCLLLHPLIIINLIGIISGQQLIVRAGHDSTPSWLLHAHLGSAIVAYAFFGLSSAIALAILIKIKALHDKKNVRFSFGLPPLLQMEYLLFKGLSIAFILLVIALGSGLWISHEATGLWFHFNHKTVFVLLSTVTFALLLIGHHQRGWRGSLAAQLVLLGTLFLILAYFGTQWVLAVLLQR